MKFEIIQRFDAGVDDVLALYSDPDFFASLDGIGQIGDPEVLEHEVDGQIVHLSVRYRYTGDLPSAALAVVDQDKLTWVETTELDLDTARSTSTIVPDHYPRRLIANAQAAFASGPGGRATRTVNGDLRVKVLLVGGQVEKAIVSGMRDHLAEEAEVGMQWMSR